MDNYPLSEKEQENGTVWPKLTTIKGRSKFRFASYIVILFVHI